MAKGLLEARIMEVEYEGKPSYAIGLFDEDGKVHYALWKFEGSKNKYTSRVRGSDPVPRPDVRPIWTTRLEWAWHSPRLKDAEEALDILKELQEWQLRYESNPKKRRK